MDCIVNISKYELSGDQPINGWIFSCYHCGSYTSNSFILNKTNYEIYVCKKCYRKHKIKEVNANEKKILCLKKKDLHIKYLEYINYCNGVVTRNKCII